MSTTNTHTHRERERERETKTHTYLNLHRYTGAHTYTRHPMYKRTLSFVPTAPLSAMPRSDVIQMHPDHDSCTTLYHCAFVTAFTGPRCVSDAAMTLTLPGISYIYDTSPSMKCHPCLHNNLRTYVDCLAVLQISSITISPCTKTPVLCESELHELSMISRHPVLVLAIDPTVFIVHLIQQGINGNYCKSFLSFFSSSSTSSGLTSCSLS